MASSGLTGSKNRIFLFDLFWLNFDVVRAKKIQKNDSDTFQSSKTFTFVETQGNVFLAKNWKKSNMAANDFQTTNLHVEMFTNLPSNISTKFHQNWSKNVEFRYFAILSQIAYFHQKIEKIPKSEGLT